MMVRKTRSWQEDGGRKIILSYFPASIFLPNILLVVTLSNLLICQAVAQKHTSPHRAIEPVSLSDVKWTDGFWNDRFATCRDKMVPSMWEIMKGTKYKPFLGHFRIAAGLSEGGYHGAKWNDGDFYKWIEAVCAVQAIERNPEWDRRLDEIISVIGKAQRADGYIHTPVLSQLAMATNRQSRFAIALTSRCTTWAT